MKRLFQLLAAALLITSCNQQNLDLPAKDNAVDFYATIGTYSVRATDTSFENGDQMAIIAKDPISSGVRKYVMSAGQLTSDNPINWIDGQTQGTEFELYYPYSSDITTNNDGKEFTVNADQSNHQSYTASDFMTGSAYAYPGNTVRFNVNHVLSKVQIYIDNRSDKGIKDVFFSNVYGKYTLKGNSTYPTGTLGTIKTCPVTENGTQAWIMVLPPQTSQPELILTTTTGEQYTYTLPSSFEFKAGYQATASITLTNDNVFTDFTATINNWTPDNNLQFTNGGQQDDNWQYLGQGKFLDGMIPGVFGFESYEMNVSVYEDINNPGRYKFQDPYKGWPFFDSWSFLFSYKEGSSIILNATNGDFAYIESGSTSGIIYNNQDELMPLSSCSENNMPGNYNYGYQYYKGCWQFEDEILMNINGQGTLLAKGRRTIFTLPGYIRQPALYEITDLGIDYDEDGVYYKYYRARAPHDAKNFGFSILEGNTIYWEDIEKTMNGSHPNQDFFTSENDADRYYSREFPRKNTGIYTILAAGDFTYEDGEYYYGYQYLSFGYVAPGDVAPECRPEILSIGASTTSPGTEISMKVKVNDISWARYFVYPTDEYVSRNIDPESLLENAYSDGIRVSGSISAFEGEGQNVNVTGLRPSTDYTIVFIAQNMFNRTGYAVAQSSTQGEYEFVNIGYGTYIDNIISHFTLDSNFVEYRSSVEILQEKSGKPIYRVLLPFMNWWNNNQYSYYYNGQESSYIEFYAKEYPSGTYVFFKDYSCGASIYDFSPEGNPLVYHHGSGDIYDHPENYIYTQYNKQIAPGVFEIAPCVNITGTSYMYGYYSVEGAVKICLPGYEYDGYAQTRATLRSAGPLKPELLKDMETTRYYNH